MVNSQTWFKAPKDSYILGLKELPLKGEFGVPEKLDHMHIYFAHCFKNQGGWEDTITRFDKGLLDLEFLNGYNII
jgi:saccharopine dehydrogenase (NAD+, L-lysine-forming)